MSVHVHIGVHKTSSSLIQVICEQHKTQLAEHGLIFERFIDNLGALLAFKGPIAPDDIKRLRDSFKSMYDGQEILISSEGFAGNPYRGYSNTKEIAEALHEILGDFKAYGYTRNPITFIESLYAQRIAEGSGMSINDFIGWIQWQHKDWDFLKEAYPGIILWSYEKTEDTVNNLLHAINPEITIKYDKKLVVNPSLSRMGLNLSRMISPLLNSKQHDDFRQFLRRHFPKNPHERLGFLDDNGKIITE